MALKSDALGSWRAYFGTADSDIFGVIEYAILVAASDCPKEFKLRRARIAELLFSCRLTQCFSCDNVQLTVPGEEDDEENEDFNGLKESLGCNEGFVNKNEIKGNGCENDGRESGRALSIQSYDDAEALTDEIEEKNQTVGEVLRIKGLLENYKEESDDLLFESMRSLQLMTLTVENLKATEIGRAVKGVRRHSSKKIQNLARSLIEGWKQMVDEWCIAGSRIDEGSPDSVKPSDADEEALPSPPFDEGASQVTQSKSYEPSQLLDGMGENGDHRSNRGFEKNHEIERKAKSDDLVSMTKGRLQNETSPIKEDLSQISKHDELIGQNKPSSFDSKPAKPGKANLESKSIVMSKSLQLKDPGQVSKKSQTISVPDKSKCSNEVPSMKLEAAKRKLHDSYQQLENAKKQRTIQVMELHDLPKRGMGNRGHHSKSGFNYRNH